MQSMTGYGSGRAALGDGQVVLDVRAVNHRFLDVRVRLPSRIHGRSPVVERVARRRLERGRIDVTARLEGQPLPAAVLDSARAQAVYRELQALRDELSPGEPVPLALLSCVPDLFVISGEVDEQALDFALEAATEAACDAVQQMRSREGKALENELVELLGCVETCCTALREAAPLLIEARRHRLRERLEALLKEIDAEVEPSRVEQEIAVLADRSDITEELARLDSHRAQMAEQIAGADMPIGRRLDFLLQEMAREANTVGAKAQSSKITSNVISLKASIEQMREQTQNVL